MNTIKVFVQADTITVKVTTLAVVSVVQYLLGQDVPDVHVQADGATGGYAITVPAENEPQIQEAAKIFIDQITA